MTVLTLRLTEEKHQRLKELAKNKGMTVNKLLDEMTTLMLSEFDLETRYIARVEHGKNKAERGQELLEKAKKR